MSSGTGCWMISLKNFSLSSILLSHSEDWSGLRSFHQNARVENSFFRYKSVLGGGLKARHGKAQRREVAIGCHILNRMAELGRPKSCAVVS